MGIGIESQPQTSLPKSKMWLRETASNILDEAACMEGSRKNEYVPKMFLWKPEVICKLL